VTGPWLSAVGVSKERKGDEWVVRFTVDGDSRDETFKEKDLAALDCK
jgi:hypothetical protein